MELWKKELDINLFSGIQCYFKNKEISSGTLSFESNKKITKSTLFDLASLTKALFIAPAFYFLCEKSVIRPENNIKKRLICST